ncbi:hypothetical protein [Hymenobacter sp. GOD-10R]|uniref:hypothetical protein n=1 Tax=Hymenobacter sp. GOD-10R TaxID=3093922 RepID=UPI003A5CC6FF
MVKICGAHCLFVMEATGTYNLAVAYYLHEQGGQVAVLNPLVIKRFIQIKVALLLCLLLGPLGGLVLLSFSCKNVLLPDYLQGLVARS